MGRGLSLFLLLVVTLLAIACVAPTPTPTPTPTPSPTFYRDTSTVAAGTVLRVNFPARDGNHVHGFLTVSGGANNDIIFWVEDPQGNLVHGSSSRRAYTGDTFSFRPIVTGTYKLVLDNSISVLSNKRVNVEMQVDWR